MPEKKQPEHGGVRPGAGRPKAPASAVLRLRFSLADSAEIEKRGGAIWAKRVLLEALAK